MRILHNILFAASAILLVSCLSKPAPYDLSVDLLRHADLVLEDGLETDLRVDAVDLSSGRYQTSDVSGTDPVFSWKVPEKTPDSRDVVQTAYRIILSKDRNDILKRQGTLWDTGRVPSSKSVGIVYEGAALEPDQIYYWAVETLTSELPDGVWSLPEAFHTAKSLQKGAASFNPQHFELQEPGTIRKFSGGVILADFLKDAYAQVQLRLYSKEGQDSIRVSTGETLKDGRINTHPHGTVRYYTYAIPLSKGWNDILIIPKDDERNTGKDAVKIPSHIGQVAPMRYLEIEGYEGEIPSGGIARRAVFSEFDETASYFHSDNAVLDSVWDLCRYSMKATSALGYYIDGDRERIPYEADAIINQLSHYASDDEYSIARRTVDYLMEHPTWPTEWILQGAMFVYQDYMQTGDARALEKYYDLLKARSLESLQRENGFISTRIDDLVETQDFQKTIHYSIATRINDIVDWPRGFEDDGYEFTDFNTVPNAWFICSMETLAKIARVIHQDQDALRYQQKAEGLKARFHEAFFDKEAGIYKDGLDSSHHSIHANLFPLALGLTPEDCRQSVLDYLKTRDMACSVYASQFLLDAVYEANEGDYGLHLLTKQDIRSWWNMIRVGSTITLEAWDDSFKPNQDWNHAWGAAPANIITRRLLGITLEEAGGGKVRIKPQTGSLKNLSAKVPTPRGPIFIEMRRSEKEYLLKVRIPANQQAEMILPDIPGMSRIMADNQERSGNQALILGSGWHEIRLKSHR